MELDKQEMQSIVAMYIPVVQGVRRKGGDVVESLEWPAHIKVFQKEAAQLCACPIKCVTQGSLQYK